MSAREKNFRGCLCFCLKFSFDFIFNPLRTNSISLAPEIPVVLICISFTSVDQIQSGLFIFQISHTDMELHDTSVTGNVHLLTQ